MIAKIAAVVARTCSVGAFVPRNPEYGFDVGSVGVLVVDGLVVSFWNGVADDKGEEGVGDSDGGGDE